MARTTFEIFLSSTSEDLRACRDAVRDMIGRMRETAIAMETFGARPTRPMETCRREVEQCDAMVVIVGHRYGWVPATKDGGDGIKSITWWEVTWALDAGKPVYAFLIDPKAAWEGEREQDRLMAAASDQVAAEVGRAVRNLQAFRAFLDGNTTRELFASPADLGGKVASSLHVWLLQKAVAAARASFPEGHERSLPSTPESPSSGQLAGAADQLFWQEQVHLLSARSLGKDASHVRVALIAGRANTSHPSLAAAAITELDVRTKAPQEPPDDYTTGLAGLLVGSDETEHHRYRGLVPHAHLLVLRVLGQATASTADLYAALDAAIREGAQVICMPLGGLTDSEVERVVYRRTAEQGVVVVCAAGNDGADNRVYPAAYDECIGVGATDGRGGISFFSNHGDWVTTFAPGVDIPVPAGKNAYEKRAGTSYSCAIVAGAVAMLMSANPKLRPERIKSILRKVGTDVAARARGMNDQPRMLDIHGAMAEALAREERPRSSSPPSSRPPRTVGGGGNRGRAKTKSTGPRRGKLKK